MPQVVKVAGTRPRPGDAVGPAPAAAGRTTLAGSGLNALSEQCTHGPFAPSAH